MKFLSPQTVVFLSNEIQQQKKEENYFVGTFYRLCGLEEVVIYCNPPCIQTTRQFQAEPTFTRTLSSSSFLSVSASRGSTSQSRAMRSRTKWAGSRPRTWRCRRWRWRSHISTQGRNTRPGPGRSSAHRPELQGLVLVLVLVLGGGGEHLHSVLKSFFFFLRKWKHVLPAQQSYKVWTIKLKLTVCPFTELLHSV